MHLKDIQSLLVDPLCLSDEKVDGSNEEEDDGDEKEDDGDNKEDDINEFDGELEANFSAKRGSDDYIYGVAVADGHPV